MKNSPKETIVARKKILKQRKIKNNSTIRKSIDMLVDSPKTSNINTLAKPLSAIGSFNKISKNIADTKQKIEYINKLFPDIELSIQILISSIISPKDMTSNDIHLVSDIDYIPPDILGNIIKYIKNYLDDFYNLNNEVPEIIRKVLFETGSDVKVILPDYIVSYIINRTTGISNESIDRYFNTSKSIIGISNESLTGRLNKDNVTINITITDNYDLLAKPIVLSKLRKDNIESKLGIKVSTESIDINDLYAPIVTKKPYIDIPSDIAIKPVTRPLVMSLPSESVIPVFHIGNPKKHLGYFILIDNNGYPITSDYKRNNTKPIYDYSNTDTVSKIHSQFYIDSDKGKIKQDLLTIFKDKIENSIKQSLSESIYGENVSFDPSEELYQMMLIRALEGSECKLLYIPSEMVSYSAIRYYPNGIGKSMFDDLQILLSIRAILLFAKVMNKIKSSIPITEVNLKLDEKDPDPDKTIEIVMQSVMATRQSFLPIWELNPANLVDWVHKAGIEFTFEGHPGLPDVKLDFNTTSMDHKVPDDDLEESIRKQTIMALGLNPEIVDNSFNPDFATTIVANNILLSKRVKQLQKAFVICFTDYIRKLLRFDGVVIEELKELINNNYSNIINNIKTTEYKQFIRSKKRDVIIEWIVSKIIESIDVRFPDPDEVDLENLSEAFDNYSSALDTVLDSIFSREAIGDDMIGDISNNVDTLKEIFKHYYLRKWMAENNYFTELFDLSDTEDKSLFDIISTYTNNISTNSTTFIRKIKRIQKKIDNRLAKLETDNTDEETTNTEDTDEDTDTENIE